LDEWDEKAIEEFVIQALGELYKAIEDEIAKRHARISIIAPESPTA
jgi:hypothetical protein